MCGEHLYYRSQAHYDRGSSPRVRGTQCAVIHCLVPGGIIPACAGNTRCVRLPSLSPWDHPRVCGEHMMWSGVDNPVTGSSPRVRGTPYRQWHRGVFRGIIPACAGNTGYLKLFCVYPGDHPRVCGEHSMAGSTSLADGGSSPRVRGTPGHARGHRAHRGIIPACAGNTNVTLTLCEGS